MSPDPKLTAIYLKLGTVHAKLQSIAKFSREVEQDTSKLTLFRGMMEEIKSHYNDYKELWNMLIDVHVDSNSIDSFPSTKEKAYQQDCDRYYYEALSIIKVFDSPPTNSTSSSESHSFSRTLRVGNIADNLPKFDGTMEKWPFYRDTFNAMVHLDDTIPIMEKYRALITTLEGSALSMIRSLPILEANYHQAWKLLNENYDNKRILGTSYLKKLFDFKPLTEAPNLPTLRAYIVNICETIEAFNQLDIPNPHDFILLTLAMRGLDPGTRRSFERKHLDKQFPTFSSLYDHLKGECTALTLSGGESVRSNSQTNSNKFASAKPGNNSKASLFVSDENCNGNKECKSDAKKGSSKSFTAKCPVCQNGHNLHNCEVFRAATPLERFNLLKSWSGCRNCLSALHKSIKCTSDSNCKQCGKRHHSWLHLPVGDTDRPQAATLGAS